MKKLNDFAGCLDVLRNADFELAKNDNIYRIGIIGQYNLTFELAWKALQEMLRIYGAEGADTGSPREIFRLGYKWGFVNDSAVWILMFKKRNELGNIYDEDNISEMILLIRDRFIPAFSVLLGTLKEKNGESEKDCK